MVTKKLIKERVLGLVKNIINNNTLIIDSHHPLNDLQEWDSISTVDLEMSIEEAFNIEFGKSEFMSMTNIDTIADSIQKKIQP
jgi:acyl carrier protein